MFPIKNIKVQASIDPSNSKEEVNSLIKKGWSTMFYGNDRMHPFVSKCDTIKCEKTWKKEKGHCAVCKNGCFNKKQSHIWLKKH